MTTTIFLMDDHYKQCPLTCSGQIYLWNNMWIQYTQAIPANRYFWEWGKEEYIYKHTLHFWILIWQAKQNKKHLSVPHSKAQLPYATLSQERITVLICWVHIIECTQWANQTKKNLSIYYELTLTHAHSPRSGISSGKLCGDQEKAGFLRLLSNGNCNCSCCCSLWPNFCLLQTPRATLWPSNLHSHRLTSSSKSLSNYFILLLQVGLFSDIALVPASAVCFLLPWKQWNHSHCLCPALTKAWE